MRITPITIPQADSIESLRSATVIALNRMAEQINRAPASQPAITIPSFDMDALARDIQNRIYNAPIHGLRVTGMINGVGITLNLNGVITTITNFEGEASGHAGLDVRLNHVADADFYFTQVQPSLVLVQRNIWMPSFSLYTSGGLQLSADAATGAGDIMLIRGVAASGQYIALHAYANSTGSYLTMSKSGTMADKIQMICETAPYFNVVGGSYKIAGSDVINASSQFVGAGSSHTGYPVVASGFNPYVGTTQYTGLTASAGLVSSDLAPTTLPIRTNAGDLEYYNGATWVSVGAGGTVVATGLTFTSITATSKGGAVTTLS